ncbi:MAG: putative ABC transporter permease [Bacilli bacterium]|nr:putative ABC transporter permease [Bacilli bacterium]
MYYINFIFLYSFLGFVLESFYFKITNTNSHSGIFLGPINLTYGIGMLICYLFFNLLPLEPNIFSYLIYYIIFVFLTSLIEFMIGHFIHFILNIDKWDYRNFKYHFGKYLCLNNSLIWGILTFIIIYYIHPYFNQFIILTIPRLFTILLLIIFFIDFLILVKKIIKTKK